MPSKKKPPAEKRAALPLSCDYTKQFVKDWTRLSRSGRYDMKQLKTVMMLLVANDAPLGPEWKDHELTGRWSGTRECHIGGDFLLIYEIDDKSVIFTRTGTHSELF
ncbi:MAG: type II toxin-antitoxin system YafQ family toxin [Cryomorphaceae bacterium]